MDRWRSQIAKSYSWKRFPKFSLGVVPSVISLELGVSILMGYIIAFLFAGSRTKKQGRVPSLAFRFKQYRIHIHHWLVFLSILVVAAILQFFLVTPLLFYGFLGGIVAQGVFHYEDWRTVIQRVEKT